MHHHVQGTAVEARLRVRSFFDDLRETVNRQEEAGLAVVDNYVREKLFSLRQQQEDMAVLISQVTSVCLECEKSLQRTDAEVPITAFFHLVQTPTNDRSPPSLFFAPVNQNQSLTELLSGLLQQYTSKLRARNHVLDGDCSCCGRSLESS